MSPSSSSRRTRRLAVALVSLLALVAAAGAAAADDDSGVELGGGYSFRAQNPLFLLFPRLAPSPLRTPPPGRGEVAWTSVYTSFFRLGERYASAFVTLDGELWRNALGARVGLGHGLALWCEVPALRAHSGFLDHFVIEYHSIFGFDQEGRTEYPEDRYAFRLTNGLRLAYDLPEGAMAVGDSTIGLDWRLRRRSASGPAVILQAAVELPTGDETRGFGSGGIDSGLGVTLYQSRGKSLFSAHLAYQFLEIPDAFARAGVPTRDNWVADLAYERGFRNTLSLVVQLGYEQSPLRGTGMAPTDDAATTLTIGGSWQAARRWRLELAFLEDLDGESAQDFSAQLAIRRSF